jgi:queuine tRNA-ribosyltransferase catalytic subunit
VKGLTAAQLETLNCFTILGNTYHLANQPGTDLVDAMGGLHAFENWNRNILTDSGGFQMVSLLKLAEITEVCIILAVS